MTEIQVNLPELKKAISSLNSLEEGTGYMVYATSEFINHGRGAFFEQTNAMYRELMQIESAMIKIVINTKEALENAGLNFVKTDHDLGRYMNGVGVSANRY